jgi:hypothetical protein
MMQMKGSIIPVGYKLTQVREESDHKSHHIYVLIWIKKISNGINEWRTITWVPIYQMS